MRSYFQSIHHAPQLLILDKGYKSSMALNDSVKQQWFETLIIAVAVFALAALSNQISAQPLLRQWLFNILF
jgi:hypothetical protein